MIDIESATSEKLQVVITTVSDPTGGVVEFAVGEGSDPTGWVAGTWSGTWDTTTGRAVAITPLLGASQPLAITGGTVVRLWVRWHVGTEVPVRVATTLRVV